MPTKTSNSKSAWSAKDIYDMIFSTYGNAHVNANKARAKEASKYMIPYIPEKEIILTTGRYNTGKISTNLLDSIYNASQRTGVPLDIALGLAGRESTLGIGRGFKKGKSVSGTDLYSNWQQIQTIPNNKAQMKKWNSLLGRTDLTDEDYDFKSEFLIRAQDSLENTKTLDENPIDNALKFYQTGKYNPGDSRHTQMVEDEAKVLMSDPAIQKWLKTKTENQMKYGGRRKAQLGLDIREGGIAQPIANNMWYIHGRKHEDGGVTMGPNNKNGVEVEGGEVVEMIDSNHPSVGRQFAAGGQSQTMRVFSSVPLLRGVSPAQLVMEGANPNKVFAAQEKFKDRNRINDDGTRYQNGGKKKYNSTIRTEDDKNVSIRNRAIYSAVDSTSDYPKWWQAIGLGIGSNIKAITNPDNMNYNVIDSVADAAWRKRLGLSYDNKFLIPNKDGSVRLPKNVEMEIPTDTTMLKRRIASNEQFANQNNIMGEDWKIVQAMIDKDKEALDALRTTYKTGKPVVINEYAHNSRNLSKNGELIKDAINYKSPLNVMKNYTIQYDPKNKSMNYWDTYDFNEFEWGVPGKPFEIKGNIPLKKVGGIYIKPSKRGTFTAAATKRGMGVQEFASKVLANKEDYSPAMVKKANFARNASRWKKEFGGDYEPKRNEKGQIALDLNNPNDIKWLHEQQGKRGAKAVHRGQQEFLKGAFNRTTPIMLGIAAANPITTATSLAGGYLLGEVGELGGELYKGLTGEDYTREGKVIGQTIGGLGGPIGAKLFGKGATNAWNTYKSNRLNSTQTLVNVPESGLTIRPNVRTNKPKQLDVINNQKYLPTDVEDLTWKEPKALLETQAQVTRRDLKNFNRWAKLFGYEPVPLRYAETKSIADRHVQDRIRQHNTFLRGVAKPNKLQKQAIEYELAKEGITNPTDYDVYTYMATHSAPTTGAGRADLRPIQVRKHKVGNFNLSKTSDSPIGALYTQGSGRGAAGYAGMGPESGGHRRTGVVVEVARPTYFRPEASYAEWVKENDFNFGDVRSKGFHKKVANRVAETGKAPEGYNLSAEDKQILFNEIKNKFAARPEPVYETAKHALDYIKNNRPNIVKNITQLDESAFNSLSNDSKRAYNEYLGKLMILNPKAVSFSKEVKKENDRFKNAYRDAVVLEGKRRKNKYLSDIDYNPEDYTQPDFSVLKSTSRNRGNAQQHYIFRAPIGEKILEGRGFYLPTEEEIINATTNHYPLWTPGYSRNTRKFGGIKKFKFGGSMIYTINGNIKNGLSLRSKARFGKTIKIDKASYETVDEAVERYKQLYRIRYGKEPSESDINRIAWTKSLENAIDGNPNLITGYGPNVGVRGPNVTKIVSGANKNRQIARIQTVVRNKNVKSAAPQRQSINTKVSQAARAERASQFDAWQQGEAFKASTMPTDAVAVNRPTIGTGVRSGRKGRVDDIVAIERSQRSVDPLSSKSEFNVYDKAYAKKVNGKMNQFTNALLASETGGIIAGSMTYDDIVGDIIYDEELPVQNNNQTNKSVNTNIKTQNKPSNKVKINQNHNINGTFDNARPQFYAEKRLPISGTQSIAEKAGLARSGWSYADSPSFDYVPNINISMPTNYAKAVGDNSKKSTSLTPRGRVTKASTPKSVAKSITQGKDVKYSTPLAEKKESLYITGIKNNTVTPLRAGMEKVKSLSSTGSGTQLKEAPWIPQYNLINTRDWIGVGTNLAGHIASYFANNALLKKAPMPIKPVQFQAAKLRTTHNINPDLANINEVTQMNLAEVGRNTASSNTSIARKQRIMNEARDARNKLYGQKENIETQLINLDRRNRQDVYNRNIAAYNDWLDKTYVAKSNNLVEKQRNLNNLISGIPMAVNTMLGTIESRKSTNDMIRAIAAANPNVDGRLFGIGDYYSQKLPDGRTAIYNKNHKLVKYV